MKEILLKKIQSEQFYFTDEETSWLIKNIGNENPLIRDDIVFFLLSNGITKNGFSEKQFSYLKKYTISNNLIFYNNDKLLPYTLTRSFSALLNGFIIEADGNKNSIYYNNLSNHERAYFFDTAIKYINSEIDTTGFSQKYGWVHSLAHGADYLSKTVSHYLFNEKSIDSVLDSLKFIIYSVDKPFKDREDRRLANIIYSALLSNKLEQNKLNKWIVSFNFSYNTNIDLYRLTTFENILAYIFFHSIDTLKLDENLKINMLQYLKKY